MLVPMPITHIKAQRIFDMPHSMFYSCVHYRSRYTNVLQLVLCTVSTLITMCTLQLTSPQYTTAGFYTVCIVITVCTLGGHFTNVLLLLFSKGSSVITVYTFDE